MSEKFEKPMGRPLKKSKKTNVLGNNRRCRRTGNARNLYIHIYTYMYIIYVCKSVSKICTKWAKFLQQPTSYSSIENDRSEENQKFHSHNILAVAHKMSKFGLL